ncbi:MAG: TonB-dependent receptor [Gammaproteobacteria bacterium]|nr:TonB-dependent receptor [Gammaproteobacteria bacterium]
MSRVAACRALLVLVAALAAGAATAEPAPPASSAAPPRNEAPVQQLGGVEVVGVAPLPGLGVPLDQMPANVQTASGGDLQRQQSLTLADYLDTGFAGVNVNASQGNPFQPDVNFHGFTASPLLGTPEGLSVYLDGVRVNESFGDVVNWDLIPESAIASVTLIPGSNPVFGLNTLGGALSIQTKSGSDDPGTELEASGGSFGRRDFQAASGGRSGRFDYFLTGNYFDEDGWRDLSASHVRQAFGKIGWQNDSTDVDLSYTFADANLTGNGATPVSLLARRRASIFTAPDNTKNHLNFVNATASHLLAGDWLLSGNAYYRQLDTRTFNGDISDTYADDYAALIANGAGPAQAAAALADQNAIDNGTHLIQRRFGAGLQLTASADWFGFANQAVVGLGFDRGRSTFLQFRRPAALTLDHSTVPTGPPEITTSLYGASQSLGVYFTDTLSPRHWLHLTAAARYNRTAQTLDGVSIDPDSGARNPLSGDHRFRRLNPAFGFTLTPATALTLYADYNEGSRAPTVIELGCADPRVPCGLPNAFAGDPPLAQVVARTVEVGGRGQWFDRRLRWNLGLYRTRNSDDIQFVTTSTLNGQGFFKNVGDTRRQGFDLGFGGRLGVLNWRLSYSLVDATYRSAFAVNGAANSSADAGGIIRVRPGDRIPLIPRHNGRLRLDYALTGAWAIGVDLQVSSGAFLRGNENNANRSGQTNAQGTTVIGSGRIGGYAVVDLRSDYRITRRLTVFMHIANLFNRDYADSGLLSQNVFSADGGFRSDPSTWTTENAVSPAAPRAVWAGARLRWGE